MIVRNFFKKLSQSSLNVAIRRLTDRHSPSTGSSSTTIRNMSTTTLESVPKVDIDPSGVFKYILLKVYNNDTSNEEKCVTVVRGYKRCNYHSDIYDEVQEKLKPLDCEPLGGGRISHDPEAKVIQIYGYSQGYGKADHEIAAKLIKDEYPGYKITVSDEGY